jgi:hypothetical protein
MNIIDRLMDSIFKTNNARDMNLFARVKNILHKPKHFWVIVAFEKTSLSGLYIHYLMILAAIPAICGFIGMSQIGVGGFSSLIKVPFMFALLVMFISYAINLSMIYVVALVINGLAPGFDGQKDLLRAFKLSAYASTPALLGGLFGLIPMLSFMSLLCWLYTIYLIYIGLPVLMKIPGEKSLAYSLLIFPVSIASSAMMYGSFSLASSLFAPNFSHLSQESGAYIVLQAPSADLKVTPAKQIDEAQVKSEGLQTIKEPDMFPIPAESLKDFLPEQLWPFARTSMEVSTTTARISASIAKAEYEAGHQKMTLTITDIGGFSGETLPRNKESETTVEKTWQDNGRIMYQKFEKDGSRAELQITLKSGTTVLLSGSRISADFLKSLSLKLNLADLENVKRRKKTS